MCHTYIYPVRTYICNICPSALLTVLLMISTRPTSCAHEQKAPGMQWAQSVGVVTMTNQKTLLVTSMGCAKRFEAY